MEETVLLREIRYMFKGLTVTVESPSVTTVEHDRAKSLTNQADKGTASFLTEAAAEYPY